MDSVADSYEWLDRLKSLAEELNSFPSGFTLHDELVQMLGEWQYSRAEVDNTYIILLSFFLGSLQDKNISIDVAELANQIIQVRSSILRTSHPTTIPSRRTTGRGEKSSRDDSQTEDEHLGAIIQGLRHSLMSDNSASIDASSPEPAPKVQLDRRNETQNERRRSSPPPEMDSSWQGGHSADKTTNANSPAKKNKNKKEAPQETLSEQKMHIQPEAEHKVNSAYRMHLDRKHGEIEKLQEILSQKAIEAINQNKEFGSLLEIERSALQQASSVTEIELLKEILIGGTDELIEGQCELAEKLQSSYQYLQFVKTDSEQLHDELHKVRLLSMTDEFTGLPNRRAFMRRLEDEISRVKRYNIPLSLALIDLDNFKEINDKYGHPAGDAVLAWYARNALPTFRHYDMVARYGGEEFIVLFPNTTYDGALKALQKMRRRIEFAKCAVDGVHIKVPTFSAGLTVYYDDDTQESVIKRSDDALYMAKNRGRDRIEMLIPESVRDDVV